MTTKQITTIALILAGIFFLVGIYLYPQLPTSLASHWDTNGQVNGHLPKFWGLFLMPIIAIGLLLLFLLIPKIDPLAKNIEKFRKYYNNFIFIIIVFLLFIHFLSILWNLGYKFNFSTITLASIGFLFYYIGTILTHIKRNWFMGIRTPWTLSSDNVWDKTHKLGGTLFKIMGIIAVTGAFLPDKFIFIFFIPLIAIVLFLLFYSYNEYRKENK